MNQARVATSASGSGDIGLSVEIAARNDEGCPPPAGTDSNRSPHWSGAKMRGRSHLQKDPAFAPAQAGLRLLRLRRIAANKSPKNGRLPIPSGNGQPFSP